MRKKLKKEKPMKKTSCALFNIVALSLIPAVAGAAGTYYNGLGYQKNVGGYYNNYSNSRGGNYANMYKNGYTQQKMTTSRKVVKKTTKKTSEQGTAKSGFVVGAGLAHEFASWDFEMRTAGSKLTYDKLAWNVIGGEGTYYFGDSTPMQIKVGARYGKQFGETSMIDDDITKGGYLNMEWTDENGNVVANQTGHALSVGSSKDGTQMGFNAAFGLTDFFKWGRVKITPSVGFRYLKYEVSTKSNYGVSIDILESNSGHPYITCINGYNGEIQCDPFLLFYSSDGRVTITGRVEEDTDGDGQNEVSEMIQIPSIAGFSVSGVGTGGTYYYEQSGTSHKYETTWMGPYVAFDAEYEINKDNFVYGGLEIGLPLYRSEGDQPYRYDWQHPKSVEDKGSFGDAYHIGLNANWSTNITDTTAFTLGVTYDYYTVSKATAKTYMNAAHYTELYDLYTDALANNTLTDYQKAILEDEVAKIEEYKVANWVLEDKDEIKSIYKAM